MAAMKVPVYADKPFIAKNLNSRYDLKRLPGGACEEATLKRTKNGGGFWLCLLFNLLLNAQ